ncbi:hypothetical protein BDM02DRAFT_3190850 [Thelephora ganbajun]|uniref:Uncharacterized protein n=1 Tax=Thelephora ganbajun TaxID=370292 RepID=A0ACB6Z360_THEGA|nr:hypothetical protein BDM02DRAFT_3190850 [Thelephora ganbajun]
MSTQVSAPLYTYSRISGFRPINPDPQEPTSQKPESGLINKLDRLLHRKSATQSSLTPTHPTPAKNPENASATANESQPEEPSDPISLRILTWNIWFENLLKQQRTSVLIATIKSLNPLPDVCCFQECTEGFELQLQEDDWWRKTWAMTKCADQFAVTGSDYGTMVFVRRELVGKMEFKAKAWFEPFAISQTGRGLLVLELIPPKSKHPLLIATSHLDYTPQIRATQFASAISTLSVTPTGIFCGDTNIDTYPELDPLLSAGYVDSWFDTNPDSVNSPDLRTVGVTFGTAGLRGSHSSNKGDGPPRRLDYVMTRGMKVKKCELVGDKPIPKEKWETSSDEKESDLEVYVSDHLGVLVDVELA